MKDVIVIGGGIIGSTVAEKYRRDNLDVMVIDDSRPMAGTGPSGGHLKPSWFSGMSKDQYEPAMEILEEIWGLVEQKFIVYPLKNHTTVWRVDTDQVLRAPRTQATARAVRNYHNYPIVETDIGDFRTRLLVVAAGVWTDHLFPEIKITGKQGVSFRVTGVIDEPYITPWAPYKQIVAHQQTDETLWVGDGSAILQKNWTERRTEQCRKRCLKSLQLEESDVTEVRMGLRPYCKTDKSQPCLLSQVGPRCWVATGAGKSGTIGAGWAAWEIYNAAKI